MSSPNKAIELQLQIRQNAEELQDFVKDLESWEKDIKEKDHDLRHQNGTTEKDLPPIRNEAYKKKKSKVKTVSKQTSEENKKNKIKSYDYEAWAKLDVDKILEEFDKEDATHDSVSDSEEDGIHIDTEKALAEKEKETEIVAYEETKGGRLLKEAWFSNNHSLNRHIDIPPAYQALRYQEGLKGDGSLGLKGHIPHSKHRAWPNEDGINSTLMQKNTLEEQGNERDRGSEKQHRPVTRLWAKQRLEEATCVPKGEKNNNEGESVDKSTFKGSSAPTPRERKRQYAKEKATAKTSLSSVGVTQAETTKLIAGGRKGYGPMTRAMAKLNGIT